MKVYDISQEILGCVVFSGDPAPRREMLSKIEDGAICNLTAFYMCAHNGTHVDAPYHFLNDGKTVDEISIDKLVGMAYVAHHNGVITAQDAEDILLRASRTNEACTKRILVAGDAVLSLEAAKYFAKQGIYLFGNESQTVGPEDAPMAVHVALLSAEVVLLEGLRLSSVPEGAYLLSAAPLNISGSDGAPCRAILVSL